MALTELKGLIGYGMKGHSERTDKTQVPPCL